ncbi:hypothetical protein ACFYPT_25370 [Streptomyces sp. NPDC005529]|uniref:hypothetical protein n=1 Tax=unclassified Streptomyces TaxID=2593676 RepID=UPI0033A9D5B1
MTTAHPNTAQHGPPTSAPKIQETVEARDALALVHDTRRDRCGLTLGHEGPYIQVRGSAVAANWTPNRTTSGS